MKYICPKCGSIREFDTINDLPRCPVDNELLTLVDEMSASRSGERKGRLPIGVYVVVSFLFLRLLSDIVGMFVIGESVFKNADNIISLVFGVLLGVCAIGLLKRVNWLRVAAYWLSLFVIFDVFNNIREAQPAGPATAMGVIVIIPYAIVAWYLSRTHVKKYFMKSRNEEQDGVALSQALPDRCNTEKG